MALTDKLTSIADAIREKTGTSDKLTLDAMPTAIIAIETGGGGGEDVEPIVLTGDCQYACAGSIATAYISKYGHTITTDRMSNCNYMFHKSNLTSIPFELNVTPGNSNFTYMFHQSKLVETPDIQVNSSSYGSYNCMYRECKDLEKPSVLYGAYPSTITSMFEYCEKLRNLPDDYFSTWNSSRISSYTSAGGSRIFYKCYSLRKIPTSLFELFKETKNTSTTYCLYNGTFYNCYALDEIVGLPVHPMAGSSNMFTDTVVTCTRLKDFTFATNEDGTPKTANWKNQTISLYRHGFEETGTALNVNIIDTYSARAYAVIYNSGITKDKLVWNDETYQALKDDPDWYTMYSYNTVDTNFDKPYYSRYNYESAVRTINSLPDTSATGRNTIKFNEEAGSKTDGGSFSTHSAEEVAALVALADSKGWTVTFA